MKILIDDYTFLDLNAPTLPAYEAFVSGSVYWLGWCDHRGKYHHHGPAEGHRIAHHSPWKTASRGSSLGRSSKVGSAPVRSEVFQGLRRPAKSPGHFIRSAPKGKRSWYGRAELGQRGRRQGEAADQILTRPWNFRIGAAVGVLGLRHIALETVTHIRLLDEKLDGELRKALVLLAQSHATDKKAVKLRFRGQGEREVRVGYIQETPVWKTSYRLVLDDDSPLLQGWAIVENTTEQDWDGVQLTLVSGRPISFVMDRWCSIARDRGTRGVTSGESRIS